MHDIKSDIETFLKETGVTSYRLCKEAEVSGNTVHFLLKGQRSWLWPKTEEKIRDAMKRISDSLNANV